MERTRAAINRMVDLRLLTPLDPREQERFDDLVADEDRLLAALRAGPRLAAD